jgi:hypothetical protein
LSTWYWKVIPTFSFCAAVSTHGDKNNDRKIIRRII